MFLNKVQPVDLVFRHYSDMLPRIKTMLKSMLEKLKEFDEGARLIGEFPPSVFEKSFDHLLDLGYALFYRLTELGVTQFEDEETVHAFHKYWSGEWRAAGALFDNAPVFVIEDLKLVDAILDAPISTVTLAKSTYPAKKFAVQLPQRRMFGMPSEQEPRPFDLVLCSTVRPDCFNYDTMDILLADSVRISREDPKRALYARISSLNIDGEPLLSGTPILTKVDRSDEARRIMLIPVKLGLFLRTKTVDIDIVKRNVRKTKSMFNGLPMVKEFHVVRNAQAQLGGGFKKVDTESGPDFIWHVP